MEEKKYLKWYNKIGYGSGDIAVGCGQFLNLMSKDVRRKK